MTNHNELQRLVTEGGYNLEEIIEEAESKAVAQGRKVRGMTGRQSDAIVWIEGSGYPYCVYGLAICYYRTVNTVCQQS